MSKKKFVEYKIKGIDWKFFFESNASYVRAHGNDSGAISYYEDFEVHFNLACLSPGKVRHEVMHVYVASSGTNSASLDKDQMEELCAEIYESHGPDMDVLTDKLLQFGMR